MMGMVIAARLGYIEIKHVVRTYHLLGVFVLVKAASMCKAR